jgi:phosphatidylglycerophosphate synthase
VPPTTHLARLLAVLSVAVGLAALGLVRAGAPMAAVVALACHGLAVILVWRQRERLAGRLGVANALTLVRLAATCVLAGMAVVPALLPAWRWPVIITALAIAALDLVDGRLARRLGQPSAFGATVDGETDAFLVAVLAVLAFHEGQRAGSPGAQVLAIGAMRYLMLALQLAQPRLRGQVPSSWLAKWICALQIGALLYCLGPGTPAREPLTWVALAALVWSFGRDLRHLSRRPGARRPDDPAGAAAASATRSARPPPG